MKMTERLKSETRELHEEIEKCTLAKYILDHSIDLQMYKLLLWQNYVAYAVTENEVAPFIDNYYAEKHLQLKEDLLALGVQPIIPAEIPFFKCSTKAEAYGTAYVIEGSGLGGMLLAKSLKQCQQLQHIKKHHFFNGDKAALESWKSFEKQLNCQNFTEKEKEKVVEKAKDTFRFFGKILQLGSVEQ